MLRITENKDELIVRETPVAKWTISLAFAIFSSILFYYEGFTGLKLFLVSAGFAIGSFFYLIMTPATTTKIDKQSKFILIRTQSLISYSFKTYSFNEIADPIYVKETKISPGNIDYQLILPLKE